MEAQENQVALPMRSHTILGVCEAIGEDFGFNPTFLRVPFAAIVLYSPMIAIGAYLALGVVVLASRLLFPRPKAQAVVESCKKAAVANEQQRELARIHRPGQRRNGRRQRADPGAGQLSQLRRLEALGLRR